VSAKGLADATADSVAIDGPPEVLGDAETQPRPGEVVRTSVYHHHFVTPAAAVREDALKVIAPAQALDLAKALVDMR
jgi:hypothetical protein